MTEETHMLGMTRGISPLPAQAPWSFLASDLGAADLEMVDVSYICLNSGEICNMC